MTVVTVVTVVAGTVVAIRRTIRCHQQDPTIAGGGGVDRDAHGVAVERQGDEGARQHDGGERKHGQRDGRADARRPGTGEGVV